MVAEASATPGPHLVERLVDEVPSTRDGVVDARVLPVEVTLTDTRERGYHLSEGADPTATVLEEERVVIDIDGDHEDDDQDDADAGPVTDPPASGHAVRARDGSRGTRG